MIELCEKFSFSRNESFLKFYKKRKTRSQKKDLTEWSFEWVNKLKSILNAVEDFERDIDRWQSELSEYNIIDEEVFFDSQFLEFEKLDIRISQKWSDKILIISSNDMSSFNDLSRIYINKSLNVEESHQRHLQASVEKIEKTSSRITFARRVETSAH